MRNRRNYEPAPEYPDYYRARDFAGIALYVLGWETEPDEDTIWSGYENRTGRLLVVMVGDDQRHPIDPDDLKPLEPLDFCRDCGQIGCGCNVYE